MRYITTAFLLLVYASQSVAQKEATHWQFGHLIGFTFDSECLPQNTSGSEIRTMEASASMSDAHTGQLLFYSDALLVWNRDHQPMPNSGDGDPTRAENRKYTPLSQGALIVPVPGDTASYYLFSLFQSEPGSRKPPGVLTFSRIDMRLDDGKGDVVAETKNTFIRDGLAGRLTAVRHSNGHDYWLLTHEGGTNQFYVYPVTSKGLGVPDSITIGSIQNEMWGHLKASPDGTKLACTALGNIETQVDLFDFDSSTGKISNYKGLGMLKSNYGLSFSPDNSKLYVGSNSTTAIVNGLYFHEIIRQYDLNAADVAASGKSIIYNNPFINYKEHETLSEFWSPPMQIAPDGRIYASPNTNQLLCPTCGYRFLVINKPNEAGFACDVTLKTLSAGNSVAGNASDPPNFMQHYFNNLEVQECIQDEPCADIDVILAPNPAKDYVDVLVRNSCETKYSIRLIHISGRVISDGAIKTGPSHRISLDGLSAGIYLIELRFENKSITRRLFKI